LVQELSATGDKHGRQWRLNLILKRMAPSWGKFVCINFYSWAYYTSTSLVYLV
jgi:hypothetical protein